MPLPGCFILSRPASPSAEWEQLNILIMLLRGADGIANEPAHTLLCKVSMVEWMLFYSSSVCEALICIMKKMTFLLASVEWARIGVLNPRLVTG